MAAQDTTAAPWRIDGGKEEEENRSERQEAADRRWGDGEGSRQGEGGKGIERKGAATCWEATSIGKRAAGGGRGCCGLLRLACWCWHQQHDAGGVLLLLCGLALLVGYRCRWNAPQSHPTTSV
ncbi:hypothetical protein PHYSODRAFT_288651 [Phytophthora sojae]|uniref:Uncharacterized protein n=1 Tax=Phytophthora sojae (strain P6497) TaxID=1094619 RepID=G5A6F8_PHYSP|nr:hypothetical protein PHYSODRAFT_288651 [Phytophthora sojae]EGZ08913.1 hypothetical protein PHYSODRAFT_288651 [Phytophthora sojae]|eukprot:XP_009535546.1 hypothetical protein PHYSODRAFT_288651 [Phytophthora sojae]